MQDQLILVTRAPHKQAPLLELLNSQGAKPVPFASIHIAPLEIHSAEYGVTKQHILDLDQFDIVICISANAARFAGELIDQYWPQLPVNIKWLAIGKATAKALDYFDVFAQVVPGADSEALLNHPELQHVANKKILILQGNNGRELLADTLLQRAAIITQAVLYNRIVPVYTDDQIKNSLYNAALSAILITSGEALSNLTTIAKGSQQQFDISSLQATTLIVPSTRVANIASTQGYQHIKVAKSADDQSMLDALLLVRGLEADNEKKKY